MAVNDIKYGRHFTITGARWNTQGEHNTQEVHYQYEPKVKNLLDQLRTIKAGQALFAEIESGTGMITIRPPLRPNHRACYAGVTPYTKGGRLLNEMNVDFLPRLYGGSCPGVGTSPEEVLFHELLHAAQIIRGHLDMTSLPKAPHMSNFTEFCAVTASNILRSELGRPGLRAGHNGRDEAETLTDSKEYYAFYKDEIDKWFGIQQKFCRGLGRIDATFNPLRAKIAAEPAIRHVFR
jgi:hypothetical protein